MKLEILYWKTLILYGKKMCLCVIGIRKLSYPNCISASIKGDPVGILPDISCEKH